MNDNLCDCFAQLTGFEVLPVQSNSFFLVFHGITLFAFTIFYLICSNTEENLYTPSIYLHHEQCFREHTYLPTYLFNSVSRMYA